MAEEESFEATHDSDIEKEEKGKAIYDRPKTAKDVKKRKLNHQIHKETAGKQRTGPPEASLSLEYVFG